MRDDLVLLHHERPDPLAKLALVVPVSPKGELGQAEASAGWRAVAGGHRAGNEPGRVVVLGEGVLIVVPRPIDIDAGLKGQIVRLVLEWLDPSA
jgi:hypothetical protein